MKNKYIWGLPLISEKKQSSKVIKYYSVAIVALLIFGAGWSLGSGKVDLSRQNASVQSNAPNNLDYSTVEQIYDELRQNFDGKLDNTKLLDGLKTGLVAASGDPYTEYMPPEKANDFKGQLSGTFEGVGALLGKNEKGNVIVISPIDGFPAKKAGLQPRDVIAEIDGKDASTLAVDKAVEKIRGPKGTKVKLRIIRNEKEDLMFEITREEINIPSVESKILDGGIGYIKISRFGDDTADLSRKAAEKFKSDGVSKIILDLRGNPGGYLEAAVDVSSLWLNDKTVLQEKRDGKTIRTYSSRGTAPLSGITTTVLIDEGSASASEITAGALHDNKAASLLGVKSFGKGSVQEPQTLQNGGLLKITVARWYTPNGKNIDKEGIQPDQKVERSEEDYKAGRDPQLDAAIVKLQ